MFFTNSLLFGPTRLFLFLVLVYWLDQRIFRKPKAKQPKGLLAIIKYISLFILLGFVLIQVNFYDLVVLFLLIFAVFFLRIWPIDLSKNLYVQFNENYKRAVIYVIKTFENLRLKFLNRDLKTSFKFSRKKSNHFFSYLFVFIVTLLSQAYFFRFKTNNLSENWHKTLTAVKEISNQKWFFYENSMAGDLFLINFYSKLTNISEAIALASFGLVEAIAMGIVVFWVVLKITAKNYFASFTAVLTSSFMFTLLPLNLNEITQHKSIFLAMIIALPVMLICLNPKILRVDKTSYFRWMLCFFAAIFFLNLYVAVVVLPLFLVVAAIIGIKKNIVYVKRFLLAYGVVASILFLTYYTVAQIQGTDFFVFINSNIYSFSSYTLTPHLVMPFQDLVNYYQFFSLIILVLVLFKFRRAPNNWFASLGFLLFLNILFNLYHFENLKIDIDLLNQVTTVCIPIFFGISLAVILDSISLLSKNQPKYFLAQWALAVAFTGGSFAFLNGKALLQTPHRDYFVKEEVMKVYDKIDRTYMMKTFAVVNTMANHNIAKIKSNLINYDYFNSKYLEQDLIFFENIDDPLFLKENPEFNLPNSTFVFIYNENAQLLKSEINELKKQSKAREVLEELSNRGRTINLITENKLVEVYEVVNKSEQSKIRDLLF